MRYDDHRKTNTVGFSLGAWNVKIIETKAGGYVAEKGGKRKGRFCGLTDMVLFLHGKNCEDGR